MTFATSSPEETVKLASLIGSRLRGGEIILLSGSLGAGKTTFVKGLGRALGVEHKVKSPSFILERVYEGKLVIKHFDFYRLSSDEVVEAGLLEEIDDDIVAVIEWPEKASCRFEPTLAVRIEIQEEPDSRLITLKTHSSYWGKVLEDVRNEFGA